MTVATSATRWPTRGVGGGAVAGNAARFGGVRQGRIQRAQGCPKGPLALGLLLQLTAIPDLCLRKTNCRTFSVR